jgi:hypothetical protein
MKAPSRVCRRQNATTMQASANITIGIGIAEHIALAEYLEAVEARAPLHDVELEQRGLSQAGQKQAGCQRGVTARAPRHRRSASR